jgi:hypothetical protein
VPAKQRPSFLKRQKEMARLQKQREKTARRQGRKRERAEGAAGEPLPGEGEPLAAPPETPDDSAPDAPPLPQD